MEKSGVAGHDKPMNVIAAASLGIGSMVGAGIFALMGEAGAIGFAVTYSIKTSPHIIWFVMAALVCAFVSEYLLHRFTARRIQTRTPEACSHPE